MLCLPGKNKPVVLISVRLIARFYNVHQKFVKSGSLIVSIEVFHYRFVYLYSLYQLVTYRLIIYLFLCLCSYLFFQGGVVFICYALYCNPVVICIVFGIFIYSFIHLFGYIVQPSCCVAVLQSYLPSNSGLFCCQCKFQLSVLSVCLHVTALVRYN